MHADQIFKTYTHTHTHKTCPLHPAEIEVKTRGPLKQRTGNRGDEFRVRGHRARLVDTLSTGSDRVRAFP